MFYAHFVLAKKGPLSRIWLAAHWDKKLTKAHVFETNIEQSVEGIIQPKVKMALRTSGHLLLGVVRIYSRKAKYLLADCNEAFVKIKMAFRPGMVDLPEDNREAAMNAITLPEVFHDFDTEMPDLNDVDIQAQFSMNQTRAEEITMREDYGNITLDTGDDGFGDVPSMDPRTPEMLRDASEMENDFGGDALSLAQETEGTRDYSIVDQHSIAGDTASVAGHSMVAPSSMFGRESAKGRPMGLDDPIQDDGFGGSVTNGPDMLAGGLFEDGSLFEDVPPTMSPSHAPSESMGTYHDAPFPSVRSPSSPSIGGGSRPATPMEDNMSPPSSPTPSHHSMASHAPSLAPSVALSHHSIRSSRSSVLQAHATEQQRKELEAQDTTTLLHNEEESFALAPVDVSAIKGFTRAKRKRKLIVDEVKAITGEEMKAQLSDTSEIVTTLDLAPPTKRLMHWKETGGVEKLFALPGRNLHNQEIFKKYQANLTVKHTDAEKEAIEKDASFEQERAQEFQEPMPVKRETRGKKRKTPDYETEYFKHQEELIRAQEESAREERERREMRLQEKAQAEAVAAVAPSVASAASEGEDPQLETTNSVLQTPGGIPPPDHTPLHSPPQDNGFGSPEYGSEERQGRPVYPPGTPVHNYTTPLYPPGTPVHNYTTPVHDPSYQEPYPTPPTALPQADFTDQWVSQAATATATGTAIPPPQTPTHSNWGDDDHHQDHDNHHQDADDDNEEYDDFPAEVEGEEDNEMQEDETIENFEDRVLNKRAAQLHRNLSKRWDESNNIKLTSLLKRNNRKQAAQKFYSLLVLQKVMAVDVSQSDIFGELHIMKRPGFDAAAGKL